MSKPGILYSVTRESPAQIIAHLVRICFPDARSAIDLTYGHGGFWKAEHGLELVSGVELDQRLVDAARGEREATVYQGDFRELTGYGDDGYDIAVFDPPYQTDMGKGTESVMGGRFGTFATLTELREAVEQGCREAWRVSRLGVIVKVQNYVHGSKFVHMTRWVEDATGLPVYDEVHSERPQKIIDPKWKDQLSVYRRHATYLVFRKGDQTHKRRKRPKDTLSAAEAERIATGSLTVPKATVERAERLLAVRKVKP